MKRLLIATLGAIALLAPTQALAETPCDDPFVDQLGVIRDRQPVMDAIEELRSHGAEVRVRVIRDLRGVANLDQYVERVQRSCPSWQGAEGGRRSNLIVLYLAVESRDMGFFAGDQWREELESQWPRIMGQDMRPAFQDGDWGRGLVSGLNAATRSIERAQRGPEPTVIHEAPPPDLSGLWSFLRWAALLLFIGVAVLFGWRFYRSRKAEAEARRAAQLRAQSEKGKCTTAINELEDAFPVLGAHINQLARVDDPASIESLRNALQDIKNATGVASGAFSELRFDANDAGHTATEYDGMAREYADIHAKLTLVSNARSELKDRLDAAARRAEELPGNLAKAEENLSSARNRVHAVKEQGFAAKRADSALKRCRTLLSQAQSAATAKELEKAVKLCAQADTLATETALAAERYPSEKQELTERIASATRLVTEAGSAIDSGRATYETLTSSYDPSCTESVDGNGTRAMAHAAAATSLIEKAQKAVDDEDWSGAAQLLNEASSHTDEVHSLMRSIGTLEGVLEAAKKDLPDEIRAELADYEKAYAFVQRNDADTDDALFDALTGAKESLEEAAELLNAERPHYLAIDSKVDRARVVIDQAFEAARSEVDRAERLRQQAASTLRAASAATSVALEYVQDHRSDVGHSVSTTLERAQDYLAEATKWQKSGNPERVVFFARKAKEDADEALAKAKRAVREAEEEEERRARRRRAAASQSYGYPSIGSSSYTKVGSSGSFGGSMSFGGGGGGFGGSGKF